MSILSLLKELLILLKNGGYIAYHYLGRSLPLSEQRRIYKSIDANFEVKWDLYYLELTLAVTPFPRISKIFCLILGNYFYLKYILCNFNWRYHSNYPINTSICEVYFRDNSRIDLSPFLGFAECSITRMEKTDILNALSHFRLHFTFKELFASRINYVANKFKDIRLPNTIILQEGRSLEYRSLYSYAYSKGVNVEFSLKTQNTFLYAIEDLQGSSDLDFPGRLHRKSYAPNKIINISDMIIFNKDVLIVVPTLNSTEETLEWIRKTTKLVKAPRFFFSVHPTYQHLKLALAGAGFTAIDESKILYMQKYEIFVGCFSTLLSQAAEIGKSVMAIAYNSDQLERIDATLANSTIYDGSKFFMTDTEKDTIKTSKVKFQANRVRKKFESLSRIGMLRSVRCRLDRLWLGLLAKFYKFDSWHASAPYSCRPYKQTVVDLVNSLEPNTVVEIGCGLGDLLSRIHASSRFGYDTDKGVISAAQFLRGGEISFIHGDAFKVKQNEIDVLILVNWIHALSPRELNEILELFYTRVRFLVLDAIDADGADTYLYKHDFSFLGCKFERISVTRPIDESRSFHLFRVI